MIEEYSALLRFHIPEIMVEDLNTYLMQLNLELEGPKYSRDETRYSIDFKSVMDYWLFVSKLKGSPYYKYWTEFEAEQDLQSFIDSINNDTVEWDYPSIIRILSGTNSWWSPRGDMNSWYFLAALLSKSYIKVKVLPFKYVDVPSKEANEEDYYLFRETIHESRGNVNIGSLKWCMYKWLKEQGEPQPTFPSSLSNVFSDELGIAVKVGEGDPFQILGYILPKYTYIHVPFANTPRMFVFETSPHFNTWRKMGMMNYIIKEEILIEAQRLLDLQREREAEEEERRQLEFIKSCQLSQIEDGTLLSSEEIQNICRHDENSPFKEQYINSTDVRKWIKNGELFGEKDGNRWYVKKANLEVFLGTRNYIQG